MYKHSRNCFWKISIGSCFQSALFMFSMFLLSQSLFAANSEAPKISEPLAQLRDIHLPTPIGFWPLAYGWYLLGMIVCLCVGGLAYFLWHRHQRGEAKRQALALLRQYEEEYRKGANPALSAARVSELLKRVALVYFPREQVAALSGESWLVFLNEQAKEIDFNRLRFLLLELPYQAGRQKQDLTALFSLAQNWISQRKKPCLN